MVKYLMAFLLATASLCSYTDIAVSKARIVEILQKKSPATIDEFHAFFKKYDHSVVLFFDKKNYDSLATHITRMEAEVAEFAAVMQDERFVSVNYLLQEQYQHLLDLVATLRQYVGSHHALSLALKVRKFKFLLPPEVKKRGNFSLYRSLKHRLSM